MKQKTIGEVNIRQLWQELGKVKAKVKVKAKMMMSKMTFWRKTRKRKRKRRKTGFLMKLKMRIMKMATMKIIKGETLENKKTKRI